MAVGLMRARGKRKFGSHRRSIFSAALLGMLVGAAAAQSPPAACSGEQQCRLVKDACAKQNELKHNYCSDLKLHEGVVLTPQEWCYVDLARRSCGTFNKFIAQCLLSGGPHIAGGCWHVAQSIEPDTIMIDGKRIWCEGWAQIPETQACDKLPNNRASSGVQK